MREKLAVYSKIRCCCVGGIVGAGGGGKDTHDHDDIEKKYLKDVRREFDEFRVNTHLCKLRCWHLLVIYYLCE